MRKIFSNQSMTKGILGLADGDKNTAEKREAGA
jgi:hypothetical protein